ncbi:MAG: hypothetical protein ACYCZQ_11795 [Burkholderiales bacterium]
MINTPRKYLLALASGILGITAVGASVNYVVDPYGIYSKASIGSPRANKPTADTKGPMVKAYQIEHANAHTLILGNSRAEIGFDPEDSAWPPATRPVYNAALPGTGPHVSLLYLQHALTITHLNTILMGVDFMDFLVEPKAPLIQPETPRLSELESRLRVTADGKPNPYRQQQRLRDIAATLFSLNALLDSMQTFFARNDSYAENLTSLGFNPLKDYVLIAKKEGYHSIFLQRDQENIKAYLKQPHAIYLGNTTTSPPIEDMKHIIALCRANHIQLKLVIYPYHARLLEIIHDTGHWLAFEQWKGALTRMTSEDATQHPGPNLVTLWDFSGYNFYTMEPVPQKHDLHTQTKWYWEGGHFKSELGSVMLNKIFNAGQYASDKDASFGVILTPDNLLDHLENVRHQRDIYRTRYPFDFAEIQAMTHISGSGER